MSTKYSVYSYRSDEDYLHYLAEIKIKESIDYWIKLLIDADMLSIKQATKIISRVIENHLTNTYFSSWNKPELNLGKAILIDTLENHCKRMEINHKEIITYLLLAE